MFLLTYLFAFLTSSKFLKMSDINPNFFDPKNQNTHEKVRYILRYHANMKSNFGAV